MSKARHELGLPESEEKYMLFEDRRVQNFFRLVVGIFGGFILLHLVFEIFSGFGYRYFFVNDVLRHWLLTSVGVVLVSFALASGSQK